MTTLTKPGKLILGALVGGTVGFVVGSIIADHFYPEYYTEEELDDLYADNIKEYVSPENKPTTTKMEGDGMIVQTPTDYTKYYRGKRVVPNQNPDLDLAGIAALSNQVIEDRHYDDEDDYDMDAEYDEESGVWHEAGDGSEPADLETVDIWQYDEHEWIERRDETQPFVITEDEFVANLDELKIGLLTYFEDDDVLCTTQDQQPLQGDPEKVVGDYALDNIGAFSADDDLVFVRNPKLNVIFQIRRVSDSYEDTVVRKIRKPVDAPLVHNLFEDGPDIDRFVQKD